METTLNSIHKICVHRQQYFRNMLQRNQLVTHSGKVSHPREEYQKILMHKTPLLGKFL